MNPTGRRLLLLFLLFLAHIYFLQIYPNFIVTTEFSRFLLVSAVVDDGTVQIDDAIRRWGDCQDKAVFNGHYYSDKAIGVSLLGIPVYFLARACGAHWPAAFFILLLRVSCVTIPAIFFTLILARFWDRIRPGGPAYPTMIVFLFGTIAFTYAMQFVNHHVAGMLLFTSCYLVYSGAGSRWRLAAAGACAGLAVLSEYPAVFAAALITVYAAWKCRGRAAWFLAGAVPFAILLLGYNTLIFGTPFDVTYRHMAAPEHRLQHAQGIAGLVLPKPGALYGHLFGSSRGLFYFSPALLLSLPGFVLFWRDSRWRAEAALFAGISLCYLLVYSSAVNWDFGWAFGPRYLTPILPFLMTAVFVAVSDERLARNRLFRFLVICTGLLSIIVVTTGTITFPFPSDEMHAPYFLLSLPLFLNGVFSPNLGRLLIGLQGLGPAILFFFLLLSAYLAASSVTASGIRPPSVRALAVPLLAFAASVAILFAGHALTPRPTAFDLYARASDYYYMGEYYLCADDLRAALRQNPDPNTRELIRRRAWEVASRPEFHDRLP